MQFTAQDLAARIAALQAAADARGLPWRRRLDAVRPRDAFSVIGVFAEILAIDFHSALHADLSHRDRTRAPGHGRRAPPAPGPCAAKDR